MKKRGIAVAFVAVLVMACVGCSNGQTRAEETAMPTKFGVETDYDEESAIEETVAPTKQGELTMYDAENLLKSWLEEHPFGFELNIQEDTYDTGDGFLLTLYASKEFAFIKVYKDGRMFRDYPDGQEPVPIDDWYDATMALMEESQYDESENEFNRCAFYAGPTREELLRNPDEHVFDSVYFYRCTIISSPEPKVYLAMTTNEDFVFSEDGYIYIDDRDTDNPYMLKGDLVSVYGSFWSNEALTWLDKNGNVTETEYIPLIKTDRLIFNQDTPDCGELAKAMVDTLNALPKYSELHGTAEYISDAKMKLRGTYYPGHEKDFGSVRISTASSDENFYIDGYKVDLIIEKSPREDFEIEGGSPVQVTCEIASIEHTVPSIEMSWLTVSLRVITVELAE